MAGPVDRVAAVAGADGRVPVLRPAGQGRGGPEETGLPGLCLIGIGVAEPRVRWTRGRGGD
ncbi:hypothetical protein, partial [Streptomyces sp. SID6139]|uniref:hypothetical protein n=1 Tax=Streptomyces sp. SID6139 TaxID=2690320 RepID=UPI001F1A02B5